MSNFENNFTLFVFKFIIGDDIAFIIHINLFTALNDSIHKGAFTTTCGSNGHYYFVVFHDFYLFGVLLNAKEPLYKSGVLGFILIQE